MRFISGLICGMILAGSLATAESNPCEQLNATVKRQFQQQQLQFKQRLFIERYEEGKR